MSKEEMIQAVVDEYLDIQRYQCGNGRCVDCPAQGHADCMIRLVAGSLYDKGLKFERTACLVVPASSDLEDAISHEKPWMLISEQDKMEPLLKPLTQMELRHMDGQKVYCADINQMVTVHAPEEGWITFGCGLYPDDHTGMARSVTLYKEKPE